MNTDRPKPKPEPKSTENLHPRRWKPAEYSYGGVDYVVHPDRKVYRVVALKKAGSDRGSPGTVRRVKDRALAHAVYDAFIRSQERVGVAPARGGR